MKTDLYNTFGICYNRADFSALINIMHKDCIYQSFDFLYILKGKQNIIESLNLRAKQNLAAENINKKYIYKGFYIKQLFILKTLKNCCIITREFDKKALRIIYFNKKWGKISHIIGINPEKHKYVRAEKI